MIKAPWCSALILAIGLLVGFAGSSHAVADDLNTTVPAPVPPADNASQSNSAAQQPTTEDQAAAPDQAGDSDSTQGDNAATQPGSVAPAVSDRPAPQTAPVVAASNEHSFWEDTSLIGKIFIGVGALLTIASAARMFMA
jgi:hypothetical protein